MDKRIGAQLYTVRDLCKTKEDFENTMIFYQSPHKILACLTDMLEIFGDRKICLCRELTKKFEEFIRGTISEIIPICESLKGEMVLVVEGNQKQETLSYSLDDCVKMINEKINEGLSTKEAIKEVSILTKTNKKELYNFYHNKEEQENE